VSVTGTPDAPSKVGVSIADIAAGLYGYSSILTALLNRERTGCGERIDISIFECLTEWMMPPIYVWRGTGSVPARVGVRHNMIVPYGAYRCMDGSVNFAIQNEREWSRFCNAVLHLPVLVHDERFATNAHRLANRAELEALIEQQFASLHVNEVITRLDGAEIANGAVNDVEAVANHAQLAERGRWVEVPSPNGMIPALLPPHNLMGVSSQMGAVPALGEHTQQVLAELGEP
jgi:itaconate CoA-transferase